MKPKEFAQFRRSAKVDILTLASHSGIDQNKIAAFELGMEQLNPETVQMLVDAVRRIGKV